MKVIAIIADIIFHPIIASISISWALNLMTDWLGLGDKIGVAVVLSLTIIIMIMIVTYLVMTDRLEEAKRAEQGVFN